MTAKAYLGQARFLDMRIKSKIQQIESLNELATSCTAALSDMPRNPNKGRSRVEDCVMKILELQESLQTDIDRLVELKKEIRSVITTVEDTDERLVLKYRYVHNYTWEQIGNELHADARTVRRWHGKALLHVILPDNPITI